MSLIDSADVESNSMLQMIGGSGTRQCHEMSEGYC